MDEVLTTWCRRAKNEYTRILEEQRLKRADSIRHEFADNRWAFTSGQRLIPLQVIADLSIYESTELSSTSACIHSRALSMHSMID